jgi:hypothetical protein
MMVDVQSDQRLDPRLKAFLALLPGEGVANAKDRDEILEQMATPEAKAALEMTVAVTDSWGSEELAPSTELRFETLDVVSQPDGNTIKLQIVRPDNDENVACVYYIHGGAMANTLEFLRQLSCLGSDHRCSRACGGARRVSKLGWRETRLMRSRPIPRGSTTASRA